MLTLQELIEFLQTLAPDILVHTALEEVNTTAYLIFGLVEDEVKDHQKKVEQRATEIDAAIQADRAAHGHADGALYDAYADTQIDFWCIEGVLDACRDMPSEVERFMRHYGRNDTRRDHDN